MLLVILRFVGLFEDLKQSNFESFIARRQPWWRLVSMAPQCWRCSYAPALNNVSIQPYKKPHWLLVPKVRPPTETETDFRQISVFL